MSQASTTSADPRPPPTRLQRRAPSSLNVPPAGEWKVAIPLLSPLAVSPVSSPPSSSSSSCQLGEPDYTMEKPSTRCYNSGDKTEMPAWEHPAAPSFTGQSKIVAMVVPQ